MGCEPQLIHIISDGHQHVAFCPATMVALPVSEAGRAAIEAYLQTSNISLAAKSAGIDQDDLKALIGSFTDHPSQIVPELPVVADSGSGRQIDDNAALNRLVLHVSNDCNLRCLYCYAHGGSYGKPRGNMRRKIAFSSINWALQAFGSVGHVQFFGGEPLLNPRLMIEICEFFKSLCDAGKIDKLPVFGVVTNGTVGDERIIEFLRRYEIAVTVSIDGPAEVHDVIRGKGTFARADRFVKRCLDTGSIRTNFECTWTTVHVKMGISVVDLVEFFYERYGVRVLHVVPVAARKGSFLYIDPQVKLQAFKEAACHTVKTLFEGNPRANSLSYRVLESLRKRKPIVLYCPAGAGTLSVASDGGLYPCFMFAGDERFRICRFTIDGNVHENRADKVSSIIHSCHKTRHEDCSLCWAEPLCSGCIGGDLIETGDTKQRSGCDTTRAIAEAILLEVSRA